MDNVDSVLANENIVSALEKNGYSYAVAFATLQEVENGAGCGQLSIITDIMEENLPNNPV
jgi:hypothetical protein